MTPGVAHCMQQAERLGRGLPGARLPWLRDARAAALARFAQTGFPTLRDEEWKYTSVAAIEDARFGFAVPEPAEVPAGVVDAHALAGAHLLVFVDGHFAPALSRVGTLPAGVMLTNVASLLEREPQRVRTLWADNGSAPSGFAALNAACAADGAWIELAPGAVLDAPVQLLFIAGAEGLATHCRSAIVAHSGSRACVVEHHVALGRSRYLSNHVTDAAVAPGAHVDHHKLQDESPAAFHIAALRVRVGERAALSSGSFAFGGALARADIHVALDAEGAGCTLDGLYLAGERRVVDHHTRVDHARPGGTSRELYKGVLDGVARAVFNGRVVVHPGAQRSDARQTNRNLLLSDHAEVDTKPQLEIYADDVQCSHGATVGQLDADQLHYLRARGIGEAAARALLTHAFADEVVQRVRPAPLRERLDRLLRERLGAPVEARP